MKVKPETVRMIRLDPGFVPSYVDIPNTLEALQEQVGGYVEELHVVDMSHNGEPQGSIVFLVNEDGLALKLEPNFVFRLRGTDHNIVGPVLVTRVVDGEMVGADEDVDRFMGDLLLGRLASN